MIMIMSLFNSHAYILFAYIYIYIYMIFKTDINDIPMKIIVRKRNNIVKKNVYTASRRVAKQVSMLPFLVATHLLK